MKAHVNTQKSGMAVQNSSGILLTIGMIVKNEEKTLEKCLQSLQPLRDAIPCELIITDTGSTDDTVEIAKKYADEVRFFEWCNDFATARNTTLKNIRGQWYMYLDADEIFDESIQKIADFFQNGEYRFYKTAAYIQRNYNDFIRKNYSDFTAFRLSERTDDLKFSGIIHEQLFLAQPSPMKCIEAVAHHEGYVVKIVGGLKQAKSNRNRILLEKQLEEEPENSRLYSMLADCYGATLPSESETKEQILRRGLAVKGENQSAYKGTLTMQLIQYYGRFQQFCEMKKCINTWFLQPHPPLMADGEISFFVGDFYYNAAQEEKAIPYFEQFLVMYQKEKIGKLGSSIGIISRQYMTEENFCIAHGLLADCYARLEENAKAKEHMALVNVGNQIKKGEKNKLLPAFIDYLKRIPDDDLFCSTYQQLWQRDPVLTQILLEAIEEYCVCPGEYRTHLLELLAENGEEQDPVVQMACIMLNRNPEKLEERTAAILQDKEICEKKYLGELIYRLLAGKKPMGNMLENIEYAVLQQMISYISCRHTDIVRVVYEYLKEAENPKEFKQLAFYFSLVKSCIVCLNDFSKEEWETFLQYYLSFGTAYCRAVYRQDFWTEENLPYMNDEFAYLFCLKKAQEYQKKDDRANYLKYLRKGLHYCRKMRNLTEYMLKETTDQIEKEEWQQRKDLNEMEKLKIQVKENIRFLIEQDKKAEAAQLLCQYKLLAPEDADNEKIEALLLK